jgi:hypothetical protein
VIRATLVGSVGRRRDQTKATCADSSATMAMMPVMRQKTSLSSSPHIPKLTSTNAAAAAATPAAPRTGARSRTLSPAAAIELVRANSVEVAMTFQSVSENSPPSMA